jgi:hypothetical protein
MMRSKLLVEEVASTLVADIGRKRTEANMIAGPAWMLEGRTFELVQRAPARSLSLEARGPHKMTATAQASGA